MSFEALCAGLAPGYSYSELSYLVYHFATNLLSAESGISTVTVILTALYGGRAYGVSPMATPPQPCACHTGLVDPIKLYSLRGWAYIWPTCVPGSDTGLLASHLALRVPSLASLGAGGSSQRMA